MIFEKDSRVLIVAPHADDEWFSAGGTLLSLNAIGCTILPVLIVAGDVKFSVNGLVEGEERLEEFQEVAKTYTKIKPWCMIEPSTGLYRRDVEGRLDTIPRIDIVSFLDKAIAAFQPDVLIMPGPSYHQDHVAVMNACLSSIRPSSKTKIDTVLMYEEAGAEWAMAKTEFIPSVYVDITKTIEEKMNIYKDNYCSQYSESDRNAYSDSGLRSYARYRGDECGVGYAECFHLVRNVVRWS